MAETPTPLHYGPTARWSRRRVVAFAVVLALGAMGFVAYQRWPDIAARAELLYWQRRCMTYRAPPDLIIYTQDPGVGERLLASGHPYKGMTRRGETPQLTTSPAGPDPSRPTDVWYKPPPWMKLPAGQWEPGPAFLHGRRAASGVRRLVAIEMSGPTRERTLFYCRSFTPASLLHAGDYARTNATVRGIYHLASEPGEHVQVYAGQPDPDDAAAFSFRCDVGGRRGTIDGRLGDDATLTLTAREPWLRARFHEGLGRPGPWRGLKTPATRPAMRSLGRSDGAATQRQRATRP